MRVDRILRHHPLAGGAAAVCFLLLIPMGFPGCATPGERPPEIPPEAVPAGTLLGQGSLGGRVTFRGTVPEPETISMHSDAICQRSHETPATRETLLVGPGGALRNVFVRISEGIDGRFAPPATPVRLDQSGCRYTPHVVGVQVGQPLLIINSDQTLHNVHSVSQANRPFNFGMTVKGQQATRYFAHEEIMVKVKCDVHPWMGAFIGVLWHPYFSVTDDEGRFSLEGLPAGNFTVEAWHESLGSKSQTVTLGDNERKELSFVFEGK